MEDGPRTVIPHRRNQLWSGLERTGTTEGSPVIGDNWGRTVRTSSLDAIVGGLPGEDDRGQTG